MHFTAARGHARRWRSTLNLPGMHNVLNALAAIAVATEVGASDAAILKALANSTASAGASSATANSPHAGGGRSR
jgi:UDP-N-acetylmuramate-alanine ligase